MSYSPSTRSRSIGSVGRQRRRATAVAFLVASLTLAGCSGDEAAAPEEVDEPTETPQTEPEPPAEHPPLPEVQVFFSNLDREADDEVHPVPRTTTEQDLPTAALEELLAGPTSEERAQGYASWFSAETAGMLQSVEIDGGVARVSFDPDLPTVIPNASTSAGSTTLLAALDATVEQFPTVDRAVYSLDGDVAAFREWLQLAPPDGDEDPATGGTEAGSSAVVEAFFSNLDLGADTEVFPVERRVDGPRVLSGALEELLAGPTSEERAQGYASWFSAETAGMLQSVEIDGGVARVSFDPDLPTVIPNASTSAGSTTLLAALDATVEQFPTVDRAVYSLDGDVAAFYEWLQLEPPE